MNIKSFFKFMFLKPFPPMEKFGSWERENRNILFVMKTFPIGRKWFHLKRKKSNKNFQRQKGFQKFPSLTGQLLEAALEQEEVLKRSRPGHLGLQGSRGGCPALWACAQHTAARELAVEARNPAGLREGVFEESSELANWKVAPLAWSLSFSKPSV